MLGLHIDLEILREIFAEYLPYSKYDISPFYEIPQSSDYAEQVKIYENIANLAKKNGKVKGISRTSQSEYVAIPNVRSVSFSWSVDLLAEAADKQIYADVEHMIAELNAVKKTFENYDVIVVFSQTTSYGKQIICGTEYTRTVLSGRCSLTDKSIIGNDALIVDGEEIHGVLNISSSYALGGDNYKVTSDAFLVNLGTNYGNSLNVQLHVLKNSAFADKCKKAAFSGATEFRKKHVVRIKTENVAAGGVEYIDFGNAFISNCVYGNSLGNYCLIDLQFLRA